MKFRNALIAAVATAALVVPVTAFAVNPAQSAPDDQAGASSMSRAATEVAPAVIPTETRVVDAPIPAAVTCPNGYECPNGGNCSNDGICPIHGSCPNDGMCTGQGNGFGPRNDAQNRAGHHYEAEWSSHDTQYGHHYGNH